MKLVEETDSKILDTKKVSDKEAEEAFKTILTWMGEDPSREGLLETPKRVVKAYKEYFAGYSKDPNKILDKTFGDVEGYDDMVVQKKRLCTESLRTSYGSNYWNCTCCIHSKRKSCGIK